ncbi:hypothetical protein VVR12_03255 [Rothia sp. LK2588]|uniref:hypothetical protein n=1 Tax=Rothia sp. LK2588 TaxID=3114369 RepID=UPI0034CFE4E1
MTTYKLTIPIPYTTNPKTGRQEANLLSANTRKHWTDRKTKTNHWRPAGLKAAQAAALPVLTPYAEIHAHIYKARAGRYDPANLYPTAKAIIDGFTDYGLTEDDDYTHLDGPHMHHGGFDKNNPRIELTITTYPEGNPHA